MIRFLVCCYILLTPFATAFADSQAAVRLCSQNLYRIDASKTQPQETQRVVRLAKRIAKAGCHVLAAQEIAGTNKQEAQRSAEMFRAALEKITNRKWQAIVGDSRDKHISNGFFVDTAVARVTEVSSLARMVLPSLQPHGPLNYFSRGPLRLELAVHRIEQPVVVYGMHLKSKAHGWRDPAKLQFESWRIEMAEGLRRDAAQSKGIAVILGDRNTRHDGAAAKVLSGELRIEDFIQAKCSVNKEPDLRPNCQGVKKRRGQFIPMLERSFVKADLKAGKVGSYKYRGRWELIDEILVSTKSRKHFAKKGQLLGQGDGASDHLLLAVDLLLP